MTITYESKQRFLNDPSDHRHGRVYGYQLGCRCARCVDASRVWSKEQRIKKREREMARYREERAKEKAAKRKRGLAKAKAKKDVCTVDDIYLPLMGKPNADDAYGRCRVCGHPADNRHHIVPRSAGKLVVEGREISKPTVLLCGMGNASGCHGLAHQHRLHFRWVDAYEENKSVKTVLPKYGVGSGHWEFIVTDEACKYQDALGMEGWGRL